MTMQELLPSEVARHPPPSDEMVAAYAAKLAGLTAGQRDALRGKLGSIKRGDLCGVLIVTLDAPCSQCPFSGVSPNGCATPNRRARYEALLTTLLTIQEELFPEAAP